MAAKYTGASLGSLILPIIVTARLFAGNQVTVTPSQNIFVLFAFWLIGLVLGHSAQVAVVEGERKRETEIRKRHHEMQEPAVGDGPENRSTDQAGGSIALWGLPLPGWTRATSGVEQDLSRSQEQGRVRSR